MHRDQVCKSSVKETNFLPWISLQKSVKEGLLLKQTSSFQRWKRRYFKLRGRTLYYAKDSKSLIFDEVDLSDASVAETSTKNINNSFTVITPFRKLILCAENRKEMEDWIGALKSVQKWEINEASQFNMEHFSGMHNWYACSHARPTFCNVCREALSGVTSHGLSCEGFWKATCPSSCSSPLLAFVNSKSGDNQGVKFLRKFKQFLNPAQVFDLMNGGPHLGLRLFQKFSTFRILVCGGDGSVGWVLSEIDSLGLHKQCQLGVLPLGTGNDLARVLGWGSLCDDDTQLLQVLEKLERATTKMLDSLHFLPPGRWSVLTYEAPKQSPPAIKEEESEDSNIQVKVPPAPTKASQFGEGAALSCRFLCGTVNDFVADVGKAYERTADNKQEADTMARKASLDTAEADLPASGIPRCAMLNEKLDSLVRELNEESQAIVVPEGTTSPSALPGPDAMEDAKEGSFHPSPVPRIFKVHASLKVKPALVCASLPPAVDEQNKQTQAYRSISAVGKKDSNEDFNKETEKLSKTLALGSVQEKVE
ncbi:hypothetical protein JD844_003922 [Phrynosoma platyrhinos]|uniref:Diacylglycerol kinase (ATP) n=1 Tax=Phrynosoma platyrhinos TaxID=52577 RepID=A0ABQ7TMJ8_PHRPL|nr:hypothetical protein JD844_003922 [Phrynosoma platyrhinos]